MEFSCSTRTLVCGMVSVTFHMCWQVVVTVTVVEALRLIPLLLSGVCATSPIQFDMSAVMTAFHLM